MKYVLAGKTESFNLYFNINKTQKGNIIYAKTEKIFNEITDNDTIVLLHGWWARSWAKKALKDILEVYPCIDIEYLDGTFGEKERKDISAQKSTLTRFDLIDLE